MPFTPATPPATFVVLSYRRIPNIYEIAINAARWPFVDEVIVWHNGSASDRFRLESCLHRYQEGMSKVRFHVACKSQTEHHDIGGGETRPHKAVVNTFTYGRFLAAASARNEVILTCDDDVLVRNWPAIYQRHLDTGKLVTALDQSHLRLARGKYRHEFAESVCYESLLGWGSAFHRDMAQVLGRVMLTDGPDELLYRKADRMFCMLLNGPHEYMAADFRELDGARDGHALYRQPDHQQWNRRAYDRVRDVVAAEARVGS